MVVQNATEPSKHLCHKSNQTVHLSAVPPLQQNNCPGMRPRTPTSQTHSCHHQKYTAWTVGLVGPLGAVCEGEGYGEQERRHGVREWRHGFWERAHRVNNTHTTQQSRVTQGLRKRHTLGAAFLEIGAVLVLAIGANSDL